MIINLIMIMPNNNHFANSTDYFEFFSFANVQNGSSCTTTLFGTVPNQYLNGSTFLCPHILKLFLYCVSASIDCNILWFCIA